MLIDITPELKEEIRSLGSAVIDFARSGKAWLPPSDLLIFMHRVNALTARLSSAIFNAEAEKNNENEHET